MIQNWQKRPQIRQATTFTNNKWVKPTNKYTLTTNTHNEWLTSTQNQCPSWRMALPCHCQHGKDICSWSTCLSHAEVKQLLTHAPHLFWPLLDVFDFIVDFTSFSSVVMINCSSQGLNLGAGWILDGSWHPARIDLVWTYVHGCVHEYAHGYIYGYMHGYVHCIYP